MIGGRLTIVRGVGASDSVLSSFPVGTHSDGECICTGGCKVACAEGASGVSIFGVKAMLHA